MDKTTIYLPDELSRDLKLYLRRTGKRQSDVVREALGAYLARERPDWPRSIGMASDGEVPADRSEQWLRERWEETWRREGRIR